MANFPEHLNATEARIINAALTKALQAGYYVKVIEGEEGETMCPFTRDRAAIQQVVAASDSTVLRLGKPSTRQEGKFVRLGDVYLDHGNGEDVISDMSAANHAMLGQLEKIIL